MTTKVKEENYVQIQGWMVSQLGLKGNELLVYAIIFGFSQTDGQVFSGSLQYLADWTNSTKQGVIKNLKSLIDKGLINRDDKIINGVKFVEYYTTKFNGVLNKVEWGIKQSLPNNNKYNTNDNKENNDQIETEFNELWAAYPKKQGRQNAFKAYLRARKAGVDKETVLNGIKAYNRFLEANKTDPRYIKQGATWFNQECWNDEYNLNQPPAKPDQRPNKHEIPESAAWIKDLV